MQAPLDGALAGDALESLAPSRSRQLASPPRAALANATPRPVPHLREFTPAPVWRTPKRGSAKPRQTPPDPCGADAHRALDRPDASFALVSRSFARFRRQFPVSPNLHFAAKPSPARRHDLFHTDLTPCDPAELAALHAAIERMNGGRKRRRRGSRSAASQEAPDGCPGLQDGRRTSAGCASVRGRRRSAGRGPGTGTRPRGRRWWERQRSWSWESSVVWLPLPVLRERAGMRVFECRADRRSEKTLTLTLSRRTGRGDQSHLALA
jgi:hypothetical protein